MIPSRPLDLGGIINEALRIIKLTYWRAAIILLVFYLPGFVIIQIGLNDLIADTQDIVSKYSAVSPEAPILVRDYLFTSDNSKSFSSPLLRLQYSELYKSIDSVQDALNTKYPDSTSRRLLKKQVDSITEVVRTSNPQLTSIFNGELAVSFFILLAGFVILILGYIGNIAAQYDLSSRAFEDRHFNFGKIFKLTLSRSMWMLLIQYILIAFAMLFGFTIVIGITYAISPVLGILGMLISFIAVAYSGVRIIFSAIALVSEELGPFEAIKRSLILTEGMFWRVIGIGLICGLLLIVVKSFIQLPFSLIISPKLTWVVECIRGNFANIPAIFANLRAGIYAWEAIIIFGTLVCASFSPAFITTFYYDLRTRHEGTLEYSEGLPEDNLELPEEHHDQREPQD